METLEEKLEKTYIELNISLENRRSIDHYLNLLKEKDKETYEHSIRVSLLGLSIAQYVHLDPKALFYAGILHDVGKLLIDKDLLKKKGRLNKKDMEKIRKHPEYAYNLLKGIYKFSAEIALRHHRFQKDSYPKKLPKSEISLPITKKRIINYYARLLSLADFYDALTSRTNKRYSENLKPKDMKKILLAKNSDQKKLILELYKSNIFQ